MIAPNTPKTAVAMLAMFVSMALALAGIYAVVANDYGSTAGAIVVACCAPFVLYWMVSICSADSTHLVLGKHPTAPLACWARRTVIICMVLAFLYGQPDMPEQGTALVIAGSLLFLLLATPRWGSRFVPLAWAVMAAQFALPRHAWTAWLFLASLITVAAMAIWRARRKGREPSPGAQARD